MKLGKGLVAGILSFVALSIVIVFSILEHVSFPFAALVCLWILLFNFSIVKARQAPFLMCFLISFFVFLLGRQICFHYLHIEQVYPFLDQTNDYAYVNMIISLLGISTGLFLSSPTFRRMFGIKDDNAIYAAITRKVNCTREYRKACIIVFWVCYMATIIGALMQIRFVQSVGYLESYTDDAGGAGIPTVISYLSRFTLIALSLYLATKPSKKQAIVPLLAYELYACLSLLTGQRYPFIGISMYILIYLLIRSRHERQWFKTKYFVFIILSVPLLMIFLAAYDSIRVGKAFSFMNVGNSIQDFFIQQGGSVNVIRRTIYNADQLKDMNLVSLHGTYSALFENGISKRLFHITTYGGNSIERAFGTNDLAHRLSYIAYGDEYLAGRGTGTSYIAELFHDFGLVGVFGGGVIYGLIFGKVDHIVFSHKIWDGLRLAMIYYLLLAPRGGFDSFIGNVFTIYSLLGFLMVFLLTSIMTKNNENTGKLCEEKCL